MYAMCVYTPVDYIQYLKQGHTHHIIHVYGINILLALTTLLIGMKFWKTGKIVKAISESDYQKLQKSRGRSTDQPGPSRSLLVIVSD